MSLYPSLEDMVVDQMAKAQQPIAPSAQASHVQALPYPSTASAYPSTASAYPSTASANPSTAPAYPSSASAYPGLGEYMGLELPEEVIRANMPEYLPSNQHQNVVAVPTISGGGGLNMIAPISGNNPGLIKAQVSHGVRQVVLCKDRDGKIGLKVKAVNKGVFVCLVAKASPAALGGLRFGDQILQINGDNVAGFSSDKVHDILRKTSVNNIVMVIRDRPFERTLTLHKDSTGHIGFQFKDGKITSIAVNSSAARNGLLIDHNLLEVNGQNVVGIKDKDIGSIIDQGGDIITITIIPTVVYSHIMKNMSSSVIKKLMDHSVPDV